MPHGRSWRIIDKEKLASVVCFKNFNHDSFGSFTRSVNGWGFKVSCVHKLIDWCRLCLLIILSSSSEDGGSRPRQEILLPRVLLAWPAWYCSAYCSSDDPRQEAPQPGRRAWLLWY
jgi:hypothetical protein